MPLNETQNLEALRKIPRNLLKMSITKLLGDLKKQKIQLLMPKFNLKSQISMDQYLDYVIYSATLSNLKNYQW